MKKLLTGNEAVARGALEAGVAYAAAYPGTPSTEILENIAEYKNEIIAEWAPNEKVALECAFSASFAGARALASMKMVGVNVAADPLFSLAYSGINGGWCLFRQMIRDFILLRMNRTIVIMLRAQRLSCWSLATVRNRRT